jgi:hypothetical protein
MGCISSVESSIGQNNGFPQALAASKETMWSFASIARASKKSREKFSTPSLFGMWMIIGPEEFRNDTDWSAKIVLQLHQSSKTPACMVDQTTRWYTCWLRLCQDGERMVAKHIPLCPRCQKNCAAFCSCTRTYRGEEVIPTRRKPHLANQCTGC